MDGESLTDAELASFFILLVVAGNETTRNAISHGLWTLTEHPDQRAVWTADFDGVAPTAVDEIVRWASPVIFMRRTVTAPTTLSGHAFARRRQGHPLLQLGQPRRGRVRRPAALRRAALPQPARRLRRRRARTSVSAPTWPAARSPSCSASSSATCPTSGATGEPDRLRSNFINGIKHLPCRFSPAGHR